MAPAGAKLAYLAYGITSFSIESMLVREHVTCAHKSARCLLQDLARLGRWMAGKAVGLVLSGGGSRGLAHLGVLHALDDAGVPVDIIGGTSQVSPS